MPEVLYFTVVAITLYFVSDWLLGRLDTYRGRRFGQRSLVFFAILAVLAISSFALIRRLVGS